MNNACAIIIGRITVKAIEVNEKHGFSVFVEYSGHCDLIEVSVRRGKTHPGFHEHLTHDVLYAGQYTPEILEAKLNTLYANLCHIHRTGKIPEDLPVNETRYVGSVKLS